MDSMPVKTWVGRFAIVQGQPQEEGPHLRSFPRQRPDEEEDELYVLVEPDSPASEEYTDQLAEVIGRLYRQDPLSMTGAVQRALRAAHQQLLDWNQRSLREHQVGAGVGCLAVRGRIAYVAQVGPVVAYHVADGRVERIEPVDGSPEPLGKAEQVEPTFSRCQLSPGDIVVLASPRLLEMLDDETLRSILLRGPDQALVELFRLARGEQEFALVLLACAVEPDEEAPMQALAPPPPLALEPEPAEAGSDGGAGQPELPEEGTPAPNLAWEPQGSAPGVEPAPPPQASAPPAIAAWPPEPVPAAGVEDQPVTPEPPAGLSQSKVRLKGEDANIRYPRTTGVRANLPRIPAQALAAVLVILIVGLAAWCVIPSTLEESREDQFASLVDDTRISLDVARRAADPQLRRENLLAAEQSLAEAEAIDESNPVIASLRGEVAALRTELDAVLELPQLMLITDLTERVPGAFSSSDFALGAGGAYFLDREGGRVIAVSLLGPDPQPVPLFNAGDLVGAQVAGQPEHIAWAEELGALLIMDNSRRLIAARFGQAPRLLTVRDAQAWGSVDELAYAAGNLYVLDGEENQVWRYLPTESGFDSEREPMLPSTDLEQAVELAVADATYVLLADGAILRFQGDTAQMLTPAGIDQPIESPGSLTLIAESAGAGQGTQVNRVLVVDQRNKRIVVLSPDGVFRQQLKSPTFTDLRALAVDEPNNLLYVLVGAALYRTQLPPAPPAAP